jgi:hypothetical protein
MTVIIETAISIFEISQTTEKNEILVPFIQTSQVSLPFPQIQD